MAIDPTKIGANMLAAREAKGVTRAELAMQVHLYPDLIRRYEKMEVAPGILNLIDLANALGIGLDTYVAGVSPASTSPDHFRNLTKMTALVPPNEPLTQADIDKMHFDRVWIDYGLDDSGERCGEDGVILYGKLYSIDTLDGSAFEDLLLDAYDGETLGRPSGDYTVCRRPPEAKDNNVPTNDPLTIEQLREMDGEPVWVTPLGFWALVIAKHGERVKLISNDGEIVHADKEIELVGPVYRRPPEGKP